jgi:hypothetical protein
VHLLVTGGGLNAQAQWVRPRKEFLLPARVLSAKFRGKFLDFLRRAVRKGQLELPPELSLQKCLNLLNKLGRKKWNVRIQPPYRHGQGVIQYLGRYVRGGPISDRRIRRLGAQSVRVRYQNPERTKHLYMVLSVQEFLSRLVRHVPPEGVHHVRHYGLFAHTSRKRLDQARALLGQLPVQEPKERSWHEVCAEAGTEHPERCPVCGRVLIRMELPPTTRAPPRRCAA